MDCEQGAQTVIFAAVDPSLQNKSGILPFACQSLEGWCSQVSTWNGAKWRSATVHYVMTVSSRYIFITVNSVLFIGCESNSLAYELVFQIFVEGSSALRLWDLSVQLIGGVDHSAAVTAVQPTAGFVWNHGNIRRGPHTTVHVLKLVVEHAQKFFNFEYIYNLL